jgi:hypothetical protein
LPPSQVKKLTAGDGDTLVVGAQNAEIGGCLSRRRCLMTKPLILCSLILILLGTPCRTPDVGPAAQAGAPVAGTIYYVAPTGNDNNPGTVAYPWRTIQKAADTLVAGDTVYIRAGTYPERVVPQNSGSPGQYIVYAAHPGETVTIDGSSVTLPTDFAGLFEISHKSYIRVSGLRVINAGPLDNNAGILVDVSRHIIVEHNYTYNTASSGIGVWASDDVTIAGNTIEHACTNVSQECLTVAETDWFEIKDNEVFDSPQEGIIVKDNCSNGKVYRNHVHHVGSTGLYVDSWNRYTHDVVVFQNVVHDIKDNGFAVGSEDGGTLENVRIYNNIAYNNRYVGLSVSANGLSGPMQDIYIVNNTLYNNGTDWGGGILVENPNARNVVIRNNIASQNLSFQIADEAGLSTADLTVDHNLIDGYRDYGGELRGSDYVEGDPLFVNPSRVDFHLQPGSPAIDKGSATDAPADDFDGRARPLDGDDDGAAVYDIGAYETPFYSVHIYLPAVLRGY